MANGYGPETAKLSLWCGNGNRLGVGVAVNSFSAELTTIAAAFDSAEGNVRFVGDRLVVDVQKPCVQTIADCNRVADVDREHASG